VEVSQDRWPGVGSWLLFFEFFFLSALGTGSLQGSAGSALEPVILQRKGEWCCFELPSFERQLSEDPHQFRSPVGLLTRRTNVRGSQGKVENKKLDKCPVQSRTSVSSVCRPFRSEAKFLHSSDKREPLSARLSPRKGCCSKVFHEQAATLTAPNLRVTRTLKEIGFIFKFLPRKTERAGGQDAPGRNMPAAKFRVK